MFAGEQKLSERFAGFTDEELLRVLTADRAKYRPDALELAGRELSHRGLSLPLAPPPPAAAPAQVEPHAADDQDEERPESPYQLIDLFVDAALIGFAIWAVGKLNDWTEPMGGFWGTIVYGVAFIGLIFSVSSLRKRWRAKEWRD